MEGVEGLERSKQGISGGNDEVHGWLRTELSEGPLIREERSRGWEWVSNTTLEDRVITLAQFMGTESG